MPKSVRAHIYNLYSLFCSYYRNLECRWTVTAPEGLRVKLNFIDFGMDGDCDKDYIIVYDGKAAFTLSERDIFY